MKTSDMKIIRALRENARANLTTISRRTGIPVSTIFDRVRRYEGDLVTKFTVLMDFTKLGFGVRTNIFLKVGPQDREGVKSYLCVHPSVNNLYRINNGFDFAAECLFSNLKEVEDFQEDLERRFAIVDKHVFHIIDDITREKMMTIEVP